MSSTCPLIDQIVLADCREVLRDIPDESVDLVVSSPPYNLGKKYEAKRALEVYLDEQREVLVECVRVLKRTGSVFWQVGAFADRGRLIPLDIKFFPILEDLGLIPRNRIVWLRQHGLHGRRKFSARHETILWFTKSDDYLFDLDAIRVPQKYQNKKYHKGEKRGQLSCNPDGKNPGDIWAFRNVKHNHEERTVHPCQFPEDLIARIVLSTTEPGGLVLDPYMGTGTVAVVARDTDRHFVGAETDRGYHEVAMRRLAGEPTSDGVFANLKTLRKFIDRTGASPERYRYEVQVGRRATLRGQSKIYPENYHLEEFEERIAFEEQSFGARTRGDTPPEDPRSHKKPSPPPKPDVDENALSLFEQPPRSK